MRFSLVRAAVALVAALLCAWSVVLWRDQQVGGEASDRVLANPNMGDAQWEDTLDRFRSAELLDPSSDWPLARAGALLLKGDRARAARIAESVLEREPDNLQAWIVLREATVGRDPRRAAEANAQIRRLNPVPTG